MGRAWPCPRTEAAAEHRPKAEHRTGEYGACH